MASNVSITFKERVIKDLPEYIQQIVKKYDSLGIYSINISQNIRNSIEALLKIDVKWVELMHKNAQDFHNYVKTSLKELEDFLNVWENLERQSAGSNGQLMDQAQKILDKIRVSFLAIMIWRNPRSLNNLDRSELVYSQTLNSERHTIEHFASEVIRAGRGQKFEILVLNGKRDFFRTKIWTAGRPEMGSDEFFEYFKDDLHLFLDGEPINPIYIKEIKRQLNIENTVNSQVLERIYNYFFASYVNFVKFLNRNFQYGLVEKGLIENGLTYETLQRSHNTTLRNKTLTISHCPFPHLRDKSFLLTPSGIQSSQRFCDDKLIIFGKEAAEEFTTDVTLPNVGGIDSIFAFIYVNHFGYHLVDISKRATVRIKPLPDRPFVLEEDMIVIFARTQAYIINITESISVGGFNASSLILKPAPGNKATLNKNEYRITIDSGKKFIIGRDQTCNLVIPHNDISSLHAEIFHDQSQGKWMMRDLNSSNGTYFKLKSNKQQYDLTPSNSYFIDGLTIFCVENFVFCITDEAEE